MFRTPREPSDLAQQEDLSLQPVEVLGQETQAAQGDHKENNQTLNDGYGASDSERLLATPV